MALKYDLFTQNLDATERITDYLDKKVSKLDRYLKNIEDARVDLSFAKAARQQTDRHVTQITIRGKGFILRAEESADDVFTAIDAAVEKIQRQIERFKGKRSRVRGVGATPEEFIPEISPLDDEETPEIVRRKTFNLIPMDEFEAIEQMKLLGHENFFVFYNVNTNAVNVLYVRNDGKYGLIETKVG